MIFTTFSFLLAGLTAAAIPIAIHLLSRGKPKTVVFPALRFARQKFAENKRKLTLKRLLLLSLRVATFVLFGLALSRPIFVPNDAPKIGETAQNSQNSQSSEKSQNAVGEPSNAVSSAPASEAVGISGRDAPVAAAIVVDSSVRTGRVKNNEPLFETMRKTALSIVSQLPKGSEIAILDGSTDGDAFQPDRFAAKTRLEKLEIAPSGRPASASTLEALRIVAGSKLPTREVFLVTDGTRPGWAPSDVAKIRRRVAASRGDRAAEIFLVDLGDSDFQNVSLSDVSLSAETISSGATLRIDVDVERIGETARDTTLELLFFDAKKLPNDLTSASIFNDSALVSRRESQTLSFPAGRAKRAAVFQTSGLPVGSCVGCVRVVGADAASADDVRWFAVDVEPDWRLLVVAPRPTAEKAIFLTEALAPEEFRKTGRAPFELDVVPFAPTSDAAESSDASFDLTSATESDLERYRAIFLLDPPALSAETIRTLTAFVENGGGLGVFLGRAATPISAFQTSDAVRLFGAKPTAQVRVPNWNRAFRPENYDAPILAPFRPFERAGIPWDALPIGRFWRLTELAPTATVVAEFGEIGETTPDVEKNGESSRDEEATNGKKTRGDAGETSARTSAPALVENRVGLGTVALLATPISDGPNDSPWNDLTTGDAAWAFVALTDGIARRLASGSASILNYSVGETATIRSPLRTFPAIATLTTPDGDEIATPTDVERRQIRFPGTKKPGLYRVRTTPNRDGETIDKAFAVSIPSSEFDWTRPDAAEKAALWAEIPYKTLDLEAASESLEAARRGKESEPYALLVVLLAALFLAETFVANRFYKK